MKIKDKVWDKFLIETKVQNRKLLKDALLLEISERELDASLVGKRLEAKTQPSDYCFNKIFGNDWRKVYPFPVTNSPEFANERDKTLLKYVKEVEDTLGWKVNLAEPFGYATKLVKSEVNGKTFETLRKVKLGPLFTKLGQEAEQFWIKNNKFYTSKDNALYFASQYSLIISRNPIDVLRMSDHDGWSSCHSVSGTYYECAVNEALDGGAVAYVVKNKDLETISNLQQSEIFRDRERSIDGVIPLSRLRIRRFINNIEDDEEIAVPEERSYGHNFSIFYDILKSILINAQKELYESLSLNKTINLGEWDLSGGSYEDTSSRSLFGKFFGQGVKIVGSAKLQGARDQAEVWQEEVDQFLETFNGRNLKHVSAWGEVDGDMDLNHAYVSYDGSFYLEYPGDIFKDVEQKKLYDIGRDVRNVLNHNSSCYSEDVNIEYDSKSDMTKFQFQITDEVQGIPSPDDFHSFLNNLSELDGNYEEVFIGLRRYLIREGYIENPYKKLKLYHFEPLEISKRHDGDIYYKTKKRIKILSGDIFKFQVDPKYPPHMDSDIEYSFYEFTNKATTDFDYNFLKKYFADFIKQKFLQNIKEYEPELNFKGNAKHQHLINPEETQRNLVLENIGIVFSLLYKEGVVVHRWEREQNETWAEECRRVLSHGIFCDISINYTETLEQKDLQTILEFVKYVDSNIKNIFVMLARSLYHKLEQYWEQWKTQLEKENMKSVRNSYNSELDGWMDKRNHETGGQVGYQQRIFQPVDVPFSSWKKEYI